MTLQIGDFERFDRVLARVVDWAWGPPLLILLVGGGLFLTLFSRLLLFWGLGHAFQVLKGKFDQGTKPGQISHFQALSTALSATVGMGNIGGVGIAITQAGAGAVFWMWVTALVGMATKFFTCTLAIMYRGKDSLGVIQGGPMYYIEHGFGKKFRFLAIFFSMCGMIGCLALFQSNQLAEILMETYQIQPWITGLVCLSLAAFVILGGIKRIASVASYVVPSMCLLYLVCVSYILVKNYMVIPAIFNRIYQDAFSGTHSATVGTACGGMMVAARTGIKRAVFSNEAGVGTAPMAHGAAKTDQPVREGLVAMLGPFVDTIVICSLTSFVILSTDSWATTDVQGVSLTLHAFESSLGLLGRISLVTIVVLFGMSTIFGYSYYGKKCFGYLFGAEKAALYDFFYLLMLLLGAIWSARTVVNLIDISFAMMAFPNMIATLLLAPRVMEATQRYFSLYQLPRRRLKVKSKA